MFTIAVANELIQTAKRNQTRAVVHICGDKAWALAQVSAVWPSLTGAVWLGDDTPPGGEALGVDAGKRFLGQEISHLAYNGFSGIHPNSLGAVGGCVTAGGLFILLSPERKQWPDAPDADYQRLSVYGFENSSQFFLKHVAKAFTADTITVMSQTQGIKPADVINSELFKAVDAPFRSIDQQAAYDAIIKVATGHRRRPLVMTAARGRGKSASLGLAANTLVREHGKSIVITAPQRSAVNELYAFIEEAFKAQVRFYTVEEMLRHQPAADIVLVDEAAGIPVPVLKKWLKSYARIAFATTTYGYEGHGQGFELRFMKHLSAAAPQHKVMQLEQPIRWQHPDPLEALLDEALLLNAKLPTLTAIQAEPKIRFVSQLELAEDLELLTGVYALLLGAHYQTTPEDLRVLLDGSNISLAVAVADNVVVGAVMLAAEGALPKEQYENICAGKRRLKGHLVPQLVAAHTGSVDFLASASWRIIRIATHPQLRRQGIASALYKHVVNEAKSRGFAAVTSSFGFTAELLEFWRQLECKPVLLSTRKESASGAFSGVVVQPLVAGAAPTVTALQTRFATQLMAVLPDYLNTIELDALLELICQVPYEASFDAGEKRELALFANAHKPLETCLPLLQRCLMAQSTPSSVGFACAVARVFLKWPQSKIVEQGLATGKADIAKSCQYFVATALANHNT